MDRSVTTSLAEGKGHGAVRRASVWLCAAWMGISCTKGSEPAASSASPAARPQQWHSASLLANAAGSVLFVAHPDADSVTMVDIATRTILREVLLGAARPAPTESGRYEPAVQPRALAFDTKARRCS
jgi:hypothetical protein